LRESRLFRDREGGRKRKLPWHMSDYHIYHQALREGSKEDCHTCGEGHSRAGNEMLLCDGGGCGLAFHLHCLSPPLGAVPEGDWLCPRCCLPEAERAAWDVAHPVKQSSAAAAGSSHASASAHGEVAHAEALADHEAVAHLEDDEVELYVDDDDEGEIEIIETAVVAAAEVMGVGVAEVVSVVDTAADAAGSARGGVGSDGEDEVMDLPADEGIAAAEAAADLERQRREIEEMQAEHEDIDREISELQRRKRTLEMKLLSAQNTLVVAEEHGGASS